MFSVICKLRHDIILIGNTVKTRAMPVFEAQYSTTDLILHNSGINIYLPQCFSCRLYSCPCFNLNKTGSFPSDSLTFLSFSSLGKKKKKASVTKRLGSEGLPSGSASGGGGKEGSFYWEAFRSDGIEEYT